MKNKTLMILVPWFALLFSCGNQQGHEVNFENINGRKAVLFKTIGNEKLYLYFNEPEDHKVSVKLPAIIFFHGGGWRSGVSTQFDMQSEYLASRGMIAIQADYRLIKQDSVTPFDCVADGKSAVRWVRANAGRLGIDPDRIAAGGGSAGGHIAAACATIKGLDDPGEDASVSSVPDALVLFNPVFDNGPTGYGYNLFGERYNEISPFHNIRAGTPPTIVFLGTADRLVPVSTAEEYKRRMEAVGCRCDLHLYEGQEHGFFNLNKGGYKMYAETLLETDKFLVSLGYLKGTPTIDPEKQ
jgi:acetyl esterase